jgi:transcription elongation factor Elf1
VQDLIETRIDCPYCGENLTVLADASELEQEYIEDCQVCCRPIVMMVNAHLMVVVRREDDVSFE